MTDLADKIVKGWTAARGLRVLLYLIAAAAVVGAIIGIIQTVQGMPS